ncbi:MAG: glycyl-radical enzyme activating protein [Thermoplasmatota archaeon]
MSSWKDNMKIPLISGIKRHSLEDGPGIRTVAFFKGCPLRCVFCHSPETQGEGIEIGFNPVHCIGCGDCITACSSDAVDDNFVINLLKCSKCGDCVEVCPGSAKYLIGKEIPVDDLVQILMRDRNYHEHSGGGVTLSGGECTMFPDYLEDLLKRLKEEGANTLLETCGHFDMEKFKRNILPYLDGVYFDLKLSDPVDHEKYTGVKNDRILENLSRLAMERSIDLKVRTPLIPGITDTEENLRGIKRIADDLGIENLEFLPYNPFCLESARRIGRVPPDLPDHFADVDETKEIGERIRTIFKKPLT